MAPLLGYWKLRGIAQPIRYLLAHAGVEYNEKVYLGFHPRAILSETEWYGKDKYKLGLDFPNLPYYIDGTTHLTQTIAILRFLADKYDLAPVTQEEKCRVYMVEYQIVDCREQLRNTVFSSEDKYEQLKEEHEKATPLHLKTFSDFLGNNTWLGGDKMTYVDFMFYEYLYHHSVFLPGCIDKNLNLRKFMDQFEALPRIANYMKTKAFKDLMMYGPEARMENDPVKYSPYWV